MIIEKNIKIQRRLHKIKPKIPEVTKTSVDVITELGTGSGGTRNISGTSTYHVDLENLSAELNPCL